jgi:hypothetical protein
MAHLHAHKVAAVDAQLQPLGEVLGLEGGKGDGELGALAGRDHLSAGTCRHTRQCGTECRHCWPRQELRAWNCLGRSSSPSLLAQHPRTHLADLAAAAQLLVAADVQHQVQGTGQRVVGHQVLRGGAGAGQAAKVHGPGPQQQLAQLVCRNERGRFSGWIRCLGGNWQAPTCKDEMCWFGRAHRPGLSSRVHRSRSSALSGCSLHCAMAASCVGLAALRNLGCPTPKPPLLPGPLAAPPVVSSCSSASRSSSMAPEHTMHAVAQGGVLLVGSSPPAPPCTVTERHRQPSQLACMPSVAAGAPGEGASKRGGAMAPACARPRSLSDSDSRRVCLRDFLHGITAAHSRSHNRAHSCWLEAFAGWQVHPHWSSTESPCPPGRPGLPDEGGVLVGVRCLCHLLRQCQRPCRGGLDGAQRRAGLGVLPEPLAAEAAQRLQQRAAVGLITRRVAWRRRNVCRA